MQKLIQPYLEEIQKLEDAIDEVIVLRWLAYAEGVQLDKLGELVQFPRGTLNDAAYLRGIRAKILVNRSEGTIPDLIGILRALLDQTLGLVFRVKNLGQATIEVDLYGQVSETDFLLTSQLAELGRAAAVDLTVHWLPNAPSTYGFAVSDALGTPDAGEDNGFGWSGSADPANYGLVHARQS